MWIDGRPLAQIKAAASGTNANIQQHDVGSPATEVGGLAQPLGIAHPTSGYPSQVHYSNWQDSQVIHPVQYGESSSGQEFEGTSEQYFEDTSEQYFEGTNEQSFDDSGEISGMAGPSPQGEVAKVKGKKGHHHHSHHKKR